jgi:hypothetical protein
MQPEYIIEALLSVWDDLPEALGDDWLAFHAGIERLLLRLHQAQSTAEQSSAAAELILAVREFPEARRRMNAVVQDISRERGGAIRMGNEPILSLASRGKWTDWICRLFSRASPGRLERYADITAPKELPIGTRGTVTVRLTKSPSADSAVAKPMTVEAGQAVEVSLSSPTGEVAVEDDGVREVKILADRDSEPVTYYIRCLEPGRKRLDLKFRQLGVMICWIEIEVDASPGIFESTEQSQPANIVAGEVYVPPADLEIVVSMTRQNGQTQLWYELSSQNKTLGYYHKRIAGPQFPGDPLQFQMYLIRKLESLGGGTDVDGKYLTFEQAELELKSVGHWLYRQLIPDQMAGEYRRFRQHVRTLHIISDEPWIPWEIVKPFDGRDPDDVIDDDFLGCQFALARWLRSERPPSGQLNVNRLACVEAGRPPHQTPLAYAASERDYLANLAQSTGIADDSPSPADWPNVNDRLTAGNINLWHFAAHGNADPAQPDESQIILADGACLRANHFDGPYGTVVKRDRPLYFINACRVGELNWSLTQLGGWAAILVQHNWCGAVVVPLWSVNDWLAFEFARHFYDALRAGHTIGEAARITRNEVRTLAPNNPTWLAYSVYAHPLKTS